MSREWAVAISLLELVDYASLGLAPAAAPAPAPAPSQASHRAGRALKLVAAVAPAPPAPVPSPATSPSPAPSPPADPSPPDAVAAPAAVPVRGTVTFYQAGSLLIADDSEPGQAAAAVHLLTKILAAARRPPPLVEPPESIQWPLPGRDEGTLADARDYTEAYLSSRQQRAPFDDLWLMGPLPLACAGPAGLDFDAAIGRDLPALGQAAVRVLPNLQTMLTDTGAKARCWHALKRFYGLS